MFNKTYEFHKIKKELETIKALDKYALFLGQCMKIAVLIKWLITFRIKIEALKRSLFSCNAAG